MISDEADGGDEGLTPEELAAVEADKAKMKQADESIQQFRDMGWKNGGQNELIDPEDPDLHVWRDPHLR